MAVTKREQIDKDAEKFVMAYGIGPVIAALARYADRTGMKVLFRHLNKIYEGFIP